MNGISRVLGAAAIALPLLASSAFAQEEADVELTATVKESNIDLNNVYAVIDICNTFQKYGQPEVNAEIKTPFSEFCAEVDALHGALENSYKPIDEAFRTATKEMDTVYDAAMTEAGDVHDSALEAAHEIYEDTRDSDFNAAYEALDDAMGKAYRDRRAAIGAANREKSTTFARAFRAQQDARGDAYQMFLSIVANEYAESFPEGLQLTIEPKQSGSVFKGAGAAGLSSPAP